MNVVVLEKIEMTNDQVDRLEKLGSVKWFDSSNEEECKERIKDADVVVLDWIDPSGFILDLKSPSLLSLMSTGYDWIKHRSEAKNKNILISNVPAYAAEAVAEHLIGLLLCVARKIVTGDTNIKKGNKNKGYLEGFELKDKTIGIIGLGNIGKRVADISKSFNMNIVTYNRHPKSYQDIKDVSLEDLLSSSDIICISCPCNEDSKGMLDKEKLNFLKNGAVLIGTTWDILVLDEAMSLLSNGKIGGLGFDVAIEGGEIVLPNDLIKLDNVVLTPHVGYNTAEAKIRQVDICLSNIESFKHNSPTNIIN